MPDYDGNEASAKVNPKASKVPIVSKVTEETNTAAEDARTGSSPDETDGKAPSGPSVDDDVEYVHGHPVIRNGM